MKKGKNTKSNLSTYLLVFVFIAGLSLLLYPGFANWYNKRIFATNISEYTRITANTSRELIDSMISKAEKYNDKIAMRGNIFSPLNEEELKEYNEMLVMDKAAISGMMGYIRIDKIGVLLPIYHGTDEEILSAGVGHLEGTSLPIGGASTHTVLSGHRGLPSARLFTDLDKLEKNDVFSLEIYGKTLYYRVDQILIVLPNEMDSLDIVQDEDYCTLVTCTPYGINTHRLLVRGHRTDTPRGLNLRVTADAIQVERTTVALFVGVPILTIMWLKVLLRPTNKKRKNNEKNTD